LKDCARPFALWTMLPSGQSLIAVGFYRQFNRILVLGHCLRGLCRLCRSISVPASKMDIGISPSPGLLPIHLTLIFNLDLIWSFHWTDRMTLIKVVSGMVRLPTLVFGGASISWW